MTDQIHKNPQKPRVYKTQDFESYAMWKAMPSILRGQPMVMLEKFGVDNELALSLLEIKNQTEFAKRFNLDKTTLTKWNRRIEEKGLMTWIYKWARKLTPNVMHALYREILRHGKAAEIKVWMEIVENV